ncbi:MAG: sigma-70 family RNA polymerase sigma factor [Acidobacteria bacterium]|nr:sigma-70 family RNA polymerase sigma factor [Acidobacteriota bacterium]
MSVPSSVHVTELLLAWRNGEAAALDELTPLVYDELHKLAGAYLRRERRGHTLQTSGLVNEAFVRLIGQQIDWQNRAHFFGIAAQMMRRILVDYARARQTDKRGGAEIHVALDEALDEAEAQDADLVALDDALLSLAQFDPRQSRIVELRYFGGLTIQEVAEVMSLSDSTIEREWNTARLWLRRELTQK